MKRFLAKVNNTMGVVLRAPNRKGLLKMAKEFIILGFKKKEIPYYYFLFPFKKNRINYLDYLTTSEVIQIGETRQLHKPELRSLLDNKLFFSLFWKDKAVSTTTLVSYNIGSAFTFDNSTVQVDSELKLLEFFTKVFSETNQTEVFVRPPEEYGGKGCFKLTKQSLNSELSKIYENLKSGLFVHTEVVQQHEKINEIHSNSLNTMRIVSLVTDQGEIEIVNAYLRFGVGNSVVDNASLGGFCVGVDLETGKLKGGGRYLPDYREEILKHPDSGYTLEDFEIPFFKEACNEVKKAVEIVKDRFIGWDVAITPKGPIIIESNTIPDLRTSEIASDALVENKHFRKMMDEVIW